MVKQAAQVFYDLLGRWPDEAGAISFSQNPPGINALGNWIVQNSGHEFINRVTTLSGGSTDPTIWTEWAFYVVLGRQMDPYTSTAQAWISQYRTQGPAAVATNFTNSAEFATRVQTEVATP